MLRRINYAWRLIATGLAFAFFSLAGLLLHLTVFPIISWFSPEPQITKTRIQKAIHYLFRFYFNSMEKAGILTTEISGMEKVKAGETYLILSNHPTLLDYVLLVTLFPQVDFVVKPALWQNFFLKGIVKNAQYISSADQVQLLNTCTERLKKGNSLAMFPEGTRSLPHCLQPFKRGAARIALQSGRPILPIVLKVTPPTLMKGQKWYEIPPQRFAFHLQVHDPICAEEIAKDCRNFWISVRKLNTYLQDFFEVHWKHENPHKA